MEVSVPFRFRHLIEIELAPFAKFMLVENVNGCMLYLGTVFHNKMRQHRRFRGRDRGLEYVFHQADEQHRRVVPKMAANRR